VPGTRCIMAYEFRLSGTARPSFAVTPADGLWGSVPARHTGQARPGWRSDDGQPILKPIQMAPDLHSDLGFLVELWGFEPQTSCMPSSGNPSTRVSLCRSPSSRVHSVRPRPGLLRYFAAVPLPYRPTEPVTPPSRRVTSQNLPQCYR
jgi:hypothetical protein